MNAYISEFKVCTFNLFNFVAPPYGFYETENIYSDVNWVRKKDWVVRQLEEIGADIIGFQEVFSTDVLKSLTKSLGYNHFLIVDKPVKEGHVFYKPVVALASKFPIVKADKVTPNKRLIEQLHLPVDFDFSRTPIKVQIDVDGFSKIWIYVTHFKSKRSKFDRDVLIDFNSPKHVKEALLDDLHGRWASSIQRGSEASLLYQDICDEIDREDRPVLVLGDLNETIDSGVLGQLIHGGTLTRLGQKYIADLSPSQLNQIRKYALYDSACLGLTPFKQYESPTHYYGSVGTRLDYILCSKDFCPDHPHSIADIVGYDVHDKHLSNPIFEHDAECSDHAPVSIMVRANY